MGDGLWLGQRDRDCWLFGEMPGDEGSCKRWGGEPLSVPVVMQGLEVMSRVGTEGVLSLHSRSFAAVLNGG